MATVLVAAGVLFLWDYGMVHRFFVHENHILCHGRMLEFDEELGWKNRPDSKFQFPLTVSSQWRLPYAHDHKGDRIDAPLDPARETGLTRVVWILGDSSAYGLGVLGDRTFAALLRPSLAEHGMHLENFAVMGYRAFQVNKSFRARSVSEPSLPSAILVWVGINDTDITQGYFWKGPYVSFLAWHYYQAQMEDLLHRCEGKGIRVVLVTIPSREDFAPLRRINRWIREQSGRAEVVDLEVAFREGDPGGGLYAPVDDLLSDDEYPARHYHPSEKGHALVSRLVLPALLKAAEAAVR